MLTFPVESRTDVRRVAHVTRVWQGAVDRALGGESGDKLHLLWGLGQTT